MERNIEKLLQDKILTEEKKPITWRKEATWERIHAKSPAKRNVVPHYAIAACITLTIVAYVFWERTEPSEVFETTAVDVLEIVKPTEDFHPAAASTEHVVKALPTKNNPAGIQEQLAIDLSKSDSSRNSASPETVSPQIDIVSTDEDLAPKVAENQNQKVRPIIGVVIEEVPGPMIVTKKKNNRIKFLPHHKDAPPLAVPESTTLTARIN